MCRDNQLAGNFQTTKLIAATGIVLIAKKTGRTLTLKWKRVCENLYIVIQNEQKVNWELNANLTIGFHWERAEYYETNNNLNGCIATENTTPLDISE